MTLGAAILCTVLWDREEPAVMALWSMSPLAFTLSGFEHVDDRDYAQSWLVRAV